MLFAAAGDVLVGDHRQQGLLQVADFAACLGGVGGLEPFGEQFGVDVVEGVGMGEQPLIRGLGGVVSLGDLRAVAGFGDQLLLGVNRFVSGESAVQIWLSSAISRGFSYRQ